MAAQWLCAAHRGRRLTRPWMIGRWSLWGPRRVSWWTVRSRHPCRGYGVWARYGHLFCLPHPSLHHRKPTLLPCLLLLEAMTARWGEKGYEYDHQDLCCISEKGRHQTALSKWKKFRWKKGMLSPGLLAFMTPGIARNSLKLEGLFPRVATRPVFIYVHKVFTCTQAWAEVSHSLQYEGRVGYSLQEVVMEMTDIDEIWWDVKPCQRSDSPNLSWMWTWWLMAGSMLLLWEVLKAGF